MQHKSPLLQSLQSNLRLQHLSRRTEAAYIYWTKRFVRSCRLRHPAELTAGDVRQFLSDLITEHNVSASTQQQALSALLFLYRNVVGRPLEELGRLPSGRAPTTLPVVLTRDEVALVLEQLNGTSRLVGILLYGSGLRLMEAVSLRVKDLDLERGEVTVRRGKAGKDRISVIPGSLIGPLQDQLRRVKRVHEHDLLQGRGKVELPGGLERKYPKASSSWPWQWVFPARRSYREPGSGEARRHHLHPSVSSGLWRWRSGRAGFPSGRAVILCGIRSPPTCWRMGMTSGRCRSYWVTGMYRPR
jgi:integron integrase